MPAPCTRVFGGKNWLQGFAYRVGIPWWLLLGAAFAGLMIAVVTVGTQAWKALAPAWGEIRQILGGGRGKIEMRPN